MRSTVHIERLFSDADLRDIEAAVREAEAATAGEIVPYAVSHSDPYEAAAWKGATLGALVCVVAATAVYEAGRSWGGSAAGWIVLPPFAGAVAGFVAAALLRPVTRWLAGAAVIEHRVQQRANAAFLEREVFKTRDRTGVLVFLSLFERRVVVLADAGIHARVEQREWDAIVAEIVDGIRAGAPGKALAGAIRQCGELLLRHGVAVRAGDTDELPDQLHVRTE